MRLELAFHPREIIGTTVDEQYADVLDQMREWAAAEPNVEGYEIVHVWRAPFSDRHTVEAVLTMRAAVDQLALGLEQAS